MLLASVWLLAAEVWLVEEPLVVVGFEQDGVDTQDMPGLGVGPVYTGIPVACSSLVALSLLVPQTVEVD